MGGSFDVHGQTLRTAKTAWNRSRDKWLARAAARPWSEAPAAAPVATGATQEGNSPGCAVELALPGGHLHNGPFGRVRDKLPQLHTREWPPFFEAAYPAETPVTSLASALKSAAVMSSVATDFIGAAGSSPLEHGVFQHPAMGLDGHLWTP